jgi:hypothetical protein
MLYAITVTTQNNLKAPNCFRWPWFPFTIAARGKETEEQPTKNK